MNFKSLIKRMKDYFIPHTEVINKAGSTKKTWLGHEYHYDSRGCIISHRHKNSQEKTWTTYYPGTAKNYANDFILRKRVENLKSHEVVEKWYTFNQKIYAIVKAKANGDNLENIKIRINYAQEWAPFGYEVLNNLKRSFFKDIHNKLLSRFDLKATAKALSNEMMRLHSTPTTRKRYENVSVAVQKDIPQKQELASAKAPVVSPKQKPTNEIKKERWEAQLLQRMEKHDLLIARKDKILKSKMRPENKEKRLESVNRQLFQNEKAQHILNRKLSILEAMANRNGWRKTKQEERNNYTQWQREFKAQQKILKEMQRAGLSKDVIKNRRNDLSELKDIKLDTLSDYKTAQKATKVANTALKKLRNVKRQNVIFELSYIVKEKLATEKALKTETDLFRLAELREKLRILRAKRKGIVRSYQPAPRPAVAPKGPVQQLLPNFQEVRSA